MNQFKEFFYKLLDTSDWPPRWHCGKWTDFHGWLYIISDLMIWSAYFAIPILILRYITKKGDVRFNKIFILFASFILACGSTHLLDAVIFWFPAYRLSALVRFITGTISWVTVFMMVRYLPVAFSYRSATEMEAEIEQRKKVEEELRLKNNQLNEAQRIAKMGYWEWDVQNNQLSWSDNLFNIYGIEPRSEELNFESYLSKVHPDDRNFVQTNIQKALETGEFPQFYHRILLPGGRTATVHATGQVSRDESGKIVRMVGTAQDITNTKNAEVELWAKTKDLEAMNEELQKFAYVASHDLQEPLRKIITFTSLMQKDFHEGNTEKCGQYMDRVVNASSRMQNLITDILEFSLVSSAKENFEQVDLNEVVKDTINDLEATIEENGAEINFEKLPSIEANRTQMGQLFQNLLSNALKFRKENEPSKINIRSKILWAGESETHSLLAGYAVLGDPNFWRNEKFCKIYIEDNGIGFDIAYKERIFNIFQRLHSKSMFQGTGIGLAICKKIVDNHHGFIRAEGTEGKGATFIITLPLSQKNYAK